MSHFRSERIIILCSGGFCGIAPKALSFVAGVTMILTTNMYLIFQTGHLKRALAQLKTYESNHYTSALIWFIPYCYHISIFLAVICYPICIIFLYCIQKRIVLGILTYFVWIIFYDLANCVIVALSSQAAKAAMFQINVLEWFGVASRTIMDIFWLSFILTYALMVIEGKSTGRMSLRQRRTSKHVTEPPKSRLGITVRKIP